MIALEDEYYCLEWRAWLVQSLWIHLASEKTMLPSEQKAGMLIGYYVSNLLISGLLLSKTIYLFFFFFFIAYGNWGEGNGNPLLCSCLGNLMGRGSWRDTVHGVAKSWTWLSNSVHGDWRIGNWYKNFWSSATAMCLTKVLCPLPGFMKLWLVNLLVLKQVKHQTLYRSWWW